MTLLFGKAVYIGLVKRFNQIYGIVDTAEERDHGRNWESSIGIYTLSCVKELVGSFCTTWGCSLALCDDLEGWDEGERSDAQEGGDKYIL